MVDMLCRSDPMNRLIDHAVNFGGTVAAAVADLLFDAIVDPLVDFGIPRWVVEECFGRTSPPTTTTIATDLAMDLPVAASG